MSKEISGPKRILFGRRRGKPLRKYQQQAIDEIFPELRIPMDQETLDLQNLFKQKKREYWLEIGFGAGEHLAWQAEHHPEVGLIGCEPFINGVATLLRKLQYSPSETENVRLHNDAAELLIDKLPDASIQRCFLLFADPWPKTAHHKRRFVSPENIERLSRILADNAELRIATDHTGYSEWILWYMLRSDKFHWQANKPADWRLRKDDWPQTRYEEKAEREGRHSVYFRFRRVPRSG